MQISSRQPAQAAHSQGSGSLALDKFSIIAAVACLYALIVYPIIISSCDMNDMVCLSSAGSFSKVFWPVLSLAALALILPNRARLVVPTNVVYLLVCLAFAGASVTWAFRPELSLIRYLQQLMIVTSIVFPALLAARRVDMMRVLFACFAVATIINCFYLLGPPRIFAKDAIQGYTGYFQGKNYMGSFAAITLLLALHEVLYRGRRQVIGLVIAALAIVLLVLSNSKTAFGLAFVAPMLAVLTVVARRTTRLSPAIIPVAIVLGYLAIATVMGIDIYKFSYMLYGDSTFTGRRLIWEFANYEIAHRPLLGWGYQSFWLVGPDAPSVVDAPAWVKFMPNAHNGYLDATLEMGYVGLTLFLAFLVATFHATGRLVDHDARRGWLVLSLAFFIAMNNGLESLWMRGFEFLWVVFLFLVAEVGRVYLPVRRSPRVSPSALQAQFHRYERSLAGVSRRRFDG